MEEKNISDLLNCGMISVNESTPLGRSKSTIIVSGIARGGTSMVARILSEAGLFMGDERSGIVFEDVDMAKALQNHDRALLRDIISSRNGSYGSWGFKRPHIHDVLQPGDLGLFRNPRLILILRDPIAVAQRNILSMHSSAEAELTFAITALKDLVSFAMEANIPVLMVSYEKALMKRADFVARIIEFCGMEVPAASMAALKKAIVPEDSVYLQNSQLRLEGRIEGISEGKLIGWGRNPHSENPVMFDLVVDRRIATTFVANEPRSNPDNDQDAVGNFGFCLDIGPFNLTASSLISVRMSGRSLYLDGSRRTVRVLSGNDPNPWILARATKAPVTVRRWRMPYFSKIRLRRAFARFQKRWAVGD